MFDKGPRPLHSSLLALACISATAFLNLPAHAHDAPSGWSYPYACCSGLDCREVPGQSISERPNGYVINATGESIGYQDARLRPSPDGEYHWCSVAGAKDGRTICLFVPPRSY